MPATYGAGKFRRAGESGAIAVVGFTQLQQALRRIEDGATPELRHRLKLIGEHVKEAAPEFVPHKTGRHDPKDTSIEDGLKVGVTLRGASIYTTSEHGGAINVGGRVGRNHATILRRADASHYMDKAVERTAEFVEHEVNDLVDWLMTTFQEG